MCLTFLFYLTYLLQLLYHPYQPSQILLLNPQYLYVYRLLHDNLTHNPRTSTTCLDFPTWDIDKTSQSLKKLSKVHKELHFVSNLLVDVVFNLWITKMVLNRSNLQDQRPFLQPGACFWWEGVTHDYQQVIGNTILGCGNSIFGFVGWEFCLNLTDQLGCTCAGNWSYCRWVLYWLIRSLLNVGGFCCSGLIFRERDWSGSVWARGYAVIGFCILC